MTSKQRDEKKTKAFFSEDIEVFLLKTLSYSSWFSFNIFKVHKLPILDFL